MGCAAELVAPVFNGRDNPIRLVLSDAGAPLVDLSGVGRVTVRLDATTLIDSDTAGAGVITWADSIVHRGVSTNVVTLTLGGQGIAPGTYEGVQVVIFDTRYPNGLRVENEISLTVHDA